MSEKPQSGPDALHGRGETFLVQSFPDPFRPVAVKPVKRDAAPERVCLIEKSDRRLVISAAEGGSPLVPE